MANFNKLTARQAKAIAKFERGFEESDKVFSQIHKFAKEGLFSTSIGMILPSEVDNIVKELTAKGFKIGVSKEYYYEDRGFKSGPYVDIYVNWEN